MNSMERWLNSQPEDATHTIKSINKKRENPDGLALTGGRFLHLLPLPLLLLSLKNIQRNT